MSDAATARALHRLSRPLRHRAGAGWLGLGVGAAALLLGLGAWAVELGWIAGPGWVLLAWAGSIVTALVVAWLAWDALRRAHSCPAGPPAGGAGRVAPRDAHRAARSACAGDQRLAAGAGGRRSGERGGAPRCGSGRAHRQARTPARCRGSGRPGAGTRSVQPPRDRCAGPRRRSGIRWARGARWWRR